MSSIFVGILFPSDICAGQSRKGLCLDVRLTRWRFHQAAGQTGNLPRDVHLTIVWTAYGVCQGLLPGMTALHNEIKLSQLLAIIS